MINYFLLNPFISLLSPFIIYLLLYLLPSLRKNVPWYSFYRSIEGLCKKRSLLWHSISCYNEIACHYCERAHVVLRENISRYYDSISRYLRHSINFLSIQLAGQLVQTDFQQISSCQSNFKHVCDDRAHMAHMLLIFFWMIANLVYVFGT